MISEHTQNKYNRKIRINLRKFGQRPHMHIEKFGDNVIEWRGLIELWRRNRRLSQHSTYSKVELTARRRRWRL